MKRHPDDRDKPGANPGPGGHSPQKTASNLTVQQVAAIAAIARGETYADAARTVGVDNATLWRWRKEKPEFSAALDEVMESLRDGIATGLIQAGSAALKTLADLAARADDEGVRLKAATEVLNRIDGAVKAGTTGAAEAAVVVQVQASDIAAELRKRREAGE